MFILRTFVPTKVPKAAAQCRLRARLRLASPAAPTAAEAIFIALRNVLFALHQLLPLVSDVE